LDKSRYAHVEALASAGSVRKLHQDGLLDISVIHGASHRVSRFTARSAPTGSTTTQRFHQKP
jgi:hypothetical protein